MRVNLGSSFKSLFNLEHLFIFVAKVHIQHFWGRGCASALLTPRTQARHSRYPH